MPTPSQAHRRPYKAPRAAHIPPPSAILASRAHAMTPAWEWHSIRAVAIARRSSGISRGSNAGWSMPCHRGRRAHPVGPCDYRIDDWPRTRPTSGYKGQPGESFVARVDNRAAALRCQPYPLDRPRRSPLPSQGPFPPPPRRAAYLATSNSHPGPEHTRCRRRAFPFDVSNLE